MFSPRQQFFRKDRKIIIEKIIRIVRNWINERKPLEFKDYENCFQFIGDDKFRKQCMNNIKELGIED